VQRGTRPNFLYTLRSTKRDENVSTAAIDELDLALSNDNRACHMDELILRLPGSDEAPEFIRAHRATSAEVPSFLHFYEEGMPLPEYLDVLARWRAGKHLPPGFVPETFLFAFVGARIVGRIVVRHALTPSLEREGGHIGYVVLPEFRRRRYATRMLTLAVHLARERLGLHDLLVTCDDDNVGSIRVIERNGGVLQDIVKIGEQSKPVRRYWIRG
jgi:predicted acetyltransferase